MPPARFRGARPWTNRASAAPSTGVAIRSDRAAARYPPGRDSLIAANAQIGAARALLFPQISLTGSLGGQSQPLTTVLSSGPARMANSPLRPRLATDLPGGPARRHPAHGSATAQCSGLYRKTISPACARSRTRWCRTTGPSASASKRKNWLPLFRNSVRLSTLRYRGGLDSYLQVLDAEQNLFRGPAPPWPGCGRRSRNRWFSSTVRSAEARQ